MKYSLFNTYPCILLKNVGEHKKGKRLKVVRMPHGLKDQTWYLIDNPTLPSIKLNVIEGEDFEIVNEIEEDTKRKKKNV
jgi:hypothetical protein